MWGGQRGGLQAWNHSAVAEDGSAVVRSRKQSQQFPQGLLCVHGSWVLKAVFSWGHATCQHFLSVKLFLII